MVLDSSLSSSNASILNASFGKYLPMLTDTLLYSLVGRIRSSGTPPLCASVEKEHGANNLPSRICSQGQMYNCPERRQAESLEPVFREGRLIPKTLPALAQSIVRPLRAKPATMLRLLSQSLYILDFLASQSKVTSERLEKVRNLLQASQV